MHMTSWLFTITQIDLSMSGEEVAEGEAQQRQYDNRVEPLIHRDPLAISWAAASRP